MKNYLLIILLIMSSACWAQTPTPATPNSDKKIFTYAEQMPQFPGGDTALTGFFKRNIHYPDEAKQDGIQGKVYISFVVNSDGSIGNINIAREIGGGCGDEVIRVVKLMPNWKPGKQNGVSVNVQYNLPVKFQLSPEDVTPGIYIYK
jgi:periplasmic protein TonB